MRGYEGADHIPLPEFQQAGKQLTVGYFLDEITTPPLNSGLFAGFVENQHKLTVFCGLNHDNNFVGRYKGI